MKRCDWFEAAEGQDGGTRESEVGLSWTALPSTKSGNMRERRSWGRGGWWVQFDYTVGYLDNKFNQIQTPGLEVMGQHQPFFLIPIFSNWRGHSSIPSVSSCPTRTLCSSLGPRAVWQNLAALNLSWEVGYLADSLTLERGHNSQTDSEFEEMGILRIF